MFYTQPALFSGSGQAVIYSIHVYNMPFNNTATRNFISNVYIYIYVYKTKKLFRGGLDL